MCHLPVACCCGMGAKAEGITLNQLLNLFSSILKEEKSGGGFATSVSLHPSLVTAAFLLSMVGGSTYSTY